MVAPWDDQGWSTYHWGHLVYRAELQSICLLLQRSLAWKIKPKKLTKINKRNSSVFSKSLLWLLKCRAEAPCPCSAGVRVWLHQAAWKTGVYWCGREQTSKTQRTPRWKRLVLWNGLALQHWQHQQEWTETGSALFFPSCPSCPYLRHKESIPSAQGPWVESTSQHGWIDLSVIFFYFTFFPLFSTHLEKQFVSPLWCENRGEKLCHEIRIWSGHM